MRFLSVEFSTRCKIQLLEYCVAQICKEKELSARHLRYKLDLEKTLCSALRVFSFQCTSEIPAKTLQFGLVSHTARRGCVKLSQPDRCPKEKGLEMETNEPGECVLRASVPGRTHNPAPSFFNQKGILSVTRLVRFCRLGVRRVAPVRRRQHSDVGDAGAHDDAAGRRLAGRR